MDATLRALVIPVRGDRYAVELTSVREVLAAPPVTRVPDAPATVLGVANVRGHVVAVLDSAALVGLPPLGAAPVVVVVDGPGGQAGLAADAMPVTESLGADLGPSEVRVATGRRATAQGPVTLLDLDALLAPSAVARR